MSQHDMTIANDDGASVRADINAALQALVGLNSGATAPSTTFPYMLWADTTTGLLKLRNAADSAWVTVGTLASANLGLATTAGAFTAGLTNSGIALIGYATGAGGTVTQLTSKTTGVTLNKPCGKIITHDAALAAGTVAGFTVTNSLVRATDTVIAHGADGNGYKYDIRVYGLTAGSFNISLKNDTAGSLSEALPINFSIMASVDA